MSTAICEYQTESSAAVRPRTILTRQVAESPARPSDVTLRRARLLAAADIHFIECNTDATYSTYPHPAGLDQGRLLEADEETALFRVMNSFRRQADALRESLDPAQPSAPLMDEIQRMLDRADEVRNGLVRVFIKLAASIAKRFASAEFPFDELASEANMTLLLAIDKFDPEYGARFSTYATHAIRRNLCRYLTRRRKARREEAGITNLDAILETRKWTAAYQQRVERSVAALDGIMETMTERDQFILRSRFGIGDEPGVHTLQSLADRLGISRERVRQLEQRAMSKLRSMALRQQIESLA